MNFPGISIPFVYFKERSNQTFLAEYIILKVRISRKNGAKKTVLKKIIRLDFLIKRKAIHGAF